MLKVAKIGTVALGTLWENSVGTSVMSGVGSVWSVPECILIIYCCIINCHKRIGLK